MAGDTFGPDTTSLHPVKEPKEPISSVWKHITPNRFFVRLNFVLTDIVNILEELDFFCLLFNFFSFLFSVGEDSSVLQIFLFLLLC